VKICPLAHLQRRLTHQMTVLFAVGEFPRVNSRAGTAVIASRRSIVHPRRRYRPMDVLGLPSNVAKRQVPARGSACPIVYDKRNRVRGLPRRSDCLRHGPSSPRSRCQCLPCTAVASSRRSSDTSGKKLSTIA